MSFKTVPSLRVFFFESNNALYWFFFNPSCLPRRYVTKKNGPFKCVNRVWRGDWLYNLLQYKPQNWLEISCIVFVNISTLNDDNALLMLESNKGSPKESKYSITFPGITNRQTKCDPPWFDELRFIMKQLFSFSKSFFLFTLTRKMSHACTQRGVVG